jgi:Cdc6-like AAA superfamily ATPase
MFAQKPLTFAEWNGVASGGGVAAHADDAHAALRELVQVSQAPLSKKGKQPGMLILILDEMDQLISQDCGILYSLFTLPQVPRLPPSSCIF